MASLRMYPGAVDRLYRSDMVGAACERVAQAGRRYAMAISPVDTGRYKFGALVADHRSDPDGRHRRAGRQLVPLPDGTAGGWHVTRLRLRGRAAARLYNPTDYAVYLEHGTRYMRAQRIAGRTIDAMRRGETA